MIKPIPKCQSKKFKRPKRASLSTLGAKADKLMSLYIRQKYSVDGYITCVSCGRVIPWRESDCGHFISRRYYATRYVEENAHPECIGCNRFSADHMIGYTTYFIDMYGREKIDELKKESRKVLSPSQKRAIVEEAIEYYSRMLIPEP